MTSYASSRDPGPADSALTDPSGDLASPELPAQGRLLLERVRGRPRVNCYRIGSAEQYIQWIKRFIVFHGKRHPVGMAAPEAEAFLTHLAGKARVSASTQNQAKSALLPLYREVLHQEEWHRTPADGGGWRKRVGVEPTKNRLTTLARFEV